MPYKIAKLRVKNFKCFNNKKYYEFIIEDDRNPIILSGPNGFGKTTFFDAVELVFTKQITRLQKNIENAKTNLGKNILLNEADKNGTIVLSLKDDRGNILTIITVINCSVHKLSIEDSLKYHIVYGELETEMIDSLIAETDSWEDTLNDFNVLKYSAEHFNVYYYISQAESVHFLKNTIANRKDSMNALLKTENIEKRIENINKIVGKNKTSNSLIKGMTETNESELKSNLNSLKTILKNTAELPKTAYTTLLNYPEGHEVFWWDREYINIKDANVSRIEIKKELMALHNLSLDLNDLKLFYYNRDLESLYNNNNATDDFIKYCDFINEKGSVDKDAIKREIEKTQTIIDIYNYSSFIRNNMAFEKYKKDDLVQLKNLLGDIILFDVGEIDGIVNELENARKSLVGKQKVLKQLKETRGKLSVLSKEFDFDSQHCPYCNHMFSSSDELKNSFEMLSKDLESEKSADFYKVETLQKKLLTVINPDIKTINEYLKEIDEKKVEKLYLDISAFTQFVGDVNRIKNVERINSIVKENVIFKEKNDETVTFEVVKAIKENKKSYNNPEFMSNLNKYNYENIYLKYKDILAIEQSTLNSSNLVVSKINYIDGLFNIENNKEIEILKDKIKKNILQKKKLEKIRNDFTELRKIYNISIENYKNNVLDSLRVPLLIYTGKILQDYQNGLGVFVNKDEMRFVANGDAKHDILNTFSSGQLAGFVLAFLFSMNKQYILKSTDDIGFILVDDPVQTMDDINIASLVEVLRNDFPKKQIIISTHEPDKENYILYKFLKYDLRGQSFNVKEELYIND